MFGPVRFGLLIAYGLENHIGSSNRTDLQMHPTVWNGLSAVTVSYTRPSVGNSYEYDVVADRGYNIVRWRLRGTAHSKNGKAWTYDDSLSCTLKEVSPSTWFPDTLHFTDQSDDKLKLEESVAIKVISINQAIDEDVFSLAGGRVPADAIITSTGPYAPKSFETGPATKPASN